MAKALENQVFQQLDDRRPVTDDILIEPSQRRVRVVFGGVTVADSRNVMLMLEKRRLAIYYFPASDVRLELLVPTPVKSNHPGKGEASFYAVKVAGRIAEKAAWRYLQPERPDLKDYVAFYWDKMDAWFEEDDEVFVHPRDPRHRVDVLNSSRHVKVVIAGQVVAETHRPRLLFETGIRTRYYIPKVDVRMDLLEPTATVTQCPYKGNATYWSARIGDQVFPDIVWSYPFPIPECTKIQHLLAFYNEKAEIYVDGELDKGPTRR